MFSNDKNVETIAQLVEVLKHYIGLQTEFVKLDVIEKVVKLLTAIAVVTVFSIVLFIALIYLSFAAVYALEGLIGSFVLSYLVVGGFYILILFMFIVLRHRLIERPLVRFLGSLLMSK